MLLIRQGPTFPHPRFHIRRGLVGFFPADLQLVQTSEYSDYLLVDVSPVGMGLVLAKPVSPGTLLELQWQQDAAFQEPIRLKVQWSHTVTALETLTPDTIYFRIGTQLLSGCSDLLELCRALPSIQVDE